MAIPNSPSHAVSRSRSSSIALHELPPLPASSASSTASQRPAAEGPLQSRRNSEASLARSDSGRASTRAPRQSSSSLGTAGSRRNSADSVELQMPGGFNPSIHSTEAPPPIEQAPDHLASIEAAQVPSFRDVNPYFFNKSAFHARLPNDVTGCVAFVLSSMRRDAADIQPLKDLAEKQSKVLQDHGITTREQFIRLLNQVEWRDRGTALMHGMAGASGFNTGSAIVDFALADKALEGLLGSWKDVPAALSACGAGAFLGVMMSVMDVGTGPAVGKTFADAYYLRPPEDQTPDPLKGANAHTKTSLAVNISVAAGASFGAARNGGIRIPQTAITHHVGSTTQRTLGDNAIDVAGGETIGGGGMQLIRNSLDNGAGRSGFQHFLAREDLGACLDHLDKPALEQMASVARRFGSYGKNVVTEMPAAVKAVLASAPGWTSHGVLGGSFGALFSMLVAMPKTLEAHGISKKDAELYTQLAKYAVLQAVYHVWGGAMGAVAGPRATTDPSPA
ncbi:MULTISPECIES: hypothetical protein [unclassified Rhizobacter]|uniref:hypothetical protein n=1 Tax=unclassified Rhizobacter TaxID=2640088 RepID=UPI000A954325|nr:MULTISPECIES: hypothetical protein [unclassified Rhizobacter]